MQPALGVDRRRRRRLVAEVAGHQRRPAEPQLARLPRPQPRPAVDVDHDGLDAGHQPPERARAPVLLGQRDRRELGHAEGLPDRAAQALAALALDLRRARRGPDEHEPQRRQVVAVDQRMARQRPRQRRHRGHGRHAVLLHHGQERLELEARQRDDARAGMQRRVEHDRAEDVRHRDQPGDDVVGTEVRERERGEAAEHRDRAGVRVRGALGQPGGAARAHQQRDRARVDGLGPGRPGLLHRAQREQRLDARGASRPRAAVAMAPSSATTKRART